MDWTENPMEYYAEINPTRNKFGTEISCTLQFKTAWEMFQCCLTSKGYKAIRPADLRILYDANTLVGGETMRNLLCKQVM